MRFLLALLAALFFAIVLCAADPTLTLTGDLASVEVERQIIVKEKLPLVKSVPFTVAAPAGGFGYVWELPTGVKATRKKHVLEVTEAPKGLLTISVAWTAIDWMAMSVEDKSASLTFVVAEIKPPTPPDPLAAEFRALIAADTGTDKAANVVKLAAVFTQAAVLAKLDSVQTAGALVDAIRTVSRTTLPVDVLTALRKRVNEILAASLPDDPEAALTPETRTAAAELYKRIATALEAAK